MILNRINPQGFPYKLEKISVTETKVSTRGKSIIVNCPTEEMSQRWFGWAHLGEFVQIAFDNLNADEREFLISGITSNEWDKLFPEE